MTSQPIAKKSLGQYWLRDAGSLQAMCEAAAVGPNDIVLEIGPGLGTLTEILTARADQVIAVEFDKKLADELPKRLPAKNLQVITQDTLKFDFTSLPAAYKIVANIPYYLTGNLLRLLSETPNPPQLAVLLVQKEVAERVAAKPGSLSILAVITQFYWQVSLGQVVPAELFTPSPKVDSQILVLKRRQPPVFPGIDTKQFFHVIKAGFAHPRKTLLNNLSSGLRLTRYETEKLCQAAAINPTRRAQTLSLQEWHQLYAAVHT